MTVCVRACVCLAEEEPTKYAWNKISFCLNTIFLAQKSASYTGIKYARTDTHRERESQRVRKRVFERVHARAHIALSVMLSAKIMIKHKNSAAFHHQSTTFNFQMYSTTTAVQCVSECSGQKFFRCAVSISAKCALQMLCKRRGDCGERASERVGERIRTFAYRSLCKRDLLCIHPH